MSEKLTPTTELEAVNALLEHINEAPVSSLEDLALDAASALQALRRVSREIQTKGWHWNIEIKRLNKTNNNEFLVPINCVRIDTTGNSAHIDVVRRGKKLFDRRPFKNTTTFEEDTLEVTMISLLPYEDLPESVRQYIYIRAARQFQELNLGSSSISRFTEDDERMALTTIMDEELDTSDLNFGDNVSHSLARFPIGFRSF